MTAATIAAWLGALGVGAIASAVVSHYLRRKQTDAEVEALHVATADSVVGIVYAQLDRMSDRIKALEGEVHLLTRHVDALAEEVRARGGDPETVLRRPRP